MTAHSRYEARLHEIQQTMTGTLVRTSPKRTLYVRALFDYDPAKGRRRITVVENFLIAFPSGPEIVSLLSCQ